MFIYVSVRQKLRFGTFSNPVVEKADFDMFVIHGISVLQVLGLRLARYSEVFHAYLSFLRSDNSQFLLL